MITLERAIALAAEAHAGTPDKGGNPYILHPLRVMLAQSSDEARIVAVFHDVLEDVEGWNVERLRVEGFTDSMIEALLALTKREDEMGSDEGYMRFVRRAASNPIAKVVKLADLDDNMDVRRLAVVDAKVQSRLEKYSRAKALLLDE